MKPGTWLNPSWVHGFLLQPFNRMTTIGHGSLKMKKPSQRNGLKIQEPSYPRD